MKKNNIFRSALALIIFSSIALGLASCKDDIHIVGLSDYYYENAENYQAGNADLSNTIENIDINWMVGSVQISTHKLNTISFVENSDSELSEEKQLHYWVDDTTLRLKFLSCGKWDLSSIDKDLIVYVPETLTITNLKVSTLSADVTLSSLAIKESLKFNTLSGELEAELTTSLNEFDGSATSGSFTLSALSVTRFNSETVSGKTTLTVQKEPEQLNIDSTSGIINLNLPKNASFTLEYDTTSGVLSSELSYNKSDGKYVFGEGKGEYEIVTVSGNVHIKASN